MSSSQLIAHPALAERFSSGTVSIQSSGKRIDIQFPCHVKLTLHRSSNISDWHDSAKTIEDLDYVIDRAVLTIQPSLTEGRKGAYWHYRLESECHDYYLRTCSESPQEEEQRYDLVVLPRGWSEEDTPSSERRSNSKGEEIPCPSSGKDFVGMDLTDLWRAREKKRFSSFRKATLNDQFWLGISLINAQTAFQSLEGLSVGDLVVEGANNLLESTNFSAVLPVSIQLAFVNKNEMESALQDLRENPSSETRVGSFLNDLMGSLEDTAPRYPLIPPRRAESQDSEA